MTNYDDLKNMFSVGNICGKYIDRIYYILALYQENEDNND